MDVSNSEVIACFPGDRICASNENTIAGTGTYERSGYIYSSLAGIVETKTQEKVSGKQRANIIKIFCISESFDTSVNEGKQNSSSSGG